MSSDDRTTCIVTGFLSATVVILIFIISSCCVKQSEISAKRDYDIRIECIRQGGNWSDVRADRTSGYATYGCVKK